MTGAQPAGAAIGAYLDAHRTLTLATVGRDGLPHAASLLYRRDGGDLYVMVDAASRTAGNLGDTGPIAATIDDGADPAAWRSLQLTGAAELVADPTEAAGVRDALDAAFPSGAGPERRLYRLVPDEIRLLERGAERAVAASGALTRAGGVAESQIPAGVRASLEVRSAAAGEPIVRQGQAPDRFYVIVAGECDVVRDGGGGRQVLARLGPGRFFGETGLLAGVPRTATVVAVGEVRLLALTRANFRAALTELGGTAEELARAIYAGAR
ncbi:MAG TPA: cyclic nucleotide-binding domain-containing protein [Thermomicrobiales bacterium]|nr:cyclic nucleotide-binding domain-containing protein [Thermomicrobiales bacterium]